MNKNIFTLLTFLSFINFFGCELEPLHVNQPSPNTYDAVVFQSNNTLTPNKIKLHENGYIIFGNRYDPDAEQVRDFYLRVDSNAIERHLAFTNIQLNDILSYGGRVLITGYLTVAEDGAIFGELEEEHSSSISVYNRYSYPTSSRGNVLIKLEDGSVLVGGESGINRGLLIKSNPFSIPFPLDTIWTNVPSDNAFSSSIYSLKEREDGSIMAFNGGTDVTFWDEKGNLQKHIQLPIANESVANDKQFLFRDQGFLMISNAIARGRVSGPAQLCSFNADGTLASQPKEYRSLTNFNAISPTSDGGFVICGRTDEFGNGQNDAFLLKLDDNLNEEWFRTYGGALDEEAYDVKQALDGGFILLGTEKSVSATDSRPGNIGLFLVKTDSKGVVRK